MKRLVPLVFIACIACATPSTHNANAELRDVAGNLGKIRSGSMHVVLQTAASGIQPSGFAVDGKFSFDSPGTLPILDVTVKRFDRNNSQTTHVLSTGTQAFIERNGRMVNVPSSDLEGLSGLGGSSTSSPLGRIDVGSWIAGTPHVGPGGLVGTVDTDKVSANLNVGAVLNGLVSIARDLGVSAASDVTELTPAEQERVRHSVKTATLGVWSGRKDKIMRRLVIDMTFASDNTQLTQKLKALSGITLHFEARVTDLNQRVTVARPSP
jgi:hypothetical protein